MVQNVKNNILVLSLFAYVTKRATLTSKINQILLFFSFFLSFFFFFCICIYGLICASVCKQAKKNWPAMSCLLTKQAWSITISKCISSVQSTELLQVFQKAEMAEQDGKVIWNRLLYGLFLPFFQSHT